MSDNTIRKKGVYIPPRKGKIIVNIVCDDRRIGVVRVMKDVGPVLWYLSGPDAPGPDCGLPLKYDPGPGEAFHCPESGHSHPIDIAAIRAAAKRASLSASPFTLTL
jgi:hypothetical protein